LDQNTDQEGEKEKRGEPKGGEIHPEGREKQESMSKHRQTLLRRRTVQTKGGWKRETSTGFNDPGQKTWGYRVEV